MITGRVRLWRYIRGLDRTRAVPMMLTRIAVPPRASSSGEQATWYKLSLVPVPEEERLFLSYSDRDVRAINDPKLRRQIMTVRNQTVFLTEYEIFRRLLDLGIDRVRRELWTVGGGQVSIRACYKVLLRRGWSMDDAGIESVADLARHCAATLRLIIKDEASEASGHTRNLRKRRGTDKALQFPTSVADNLSATSKAAAIAFRQDPPPSVPTLVFNPASGVEITVPKQTFPLVQPTVSDRAVKASPIEMQPISGADGNLQDYFPTPNGDEPVQSNKQASRLLENIKKGLSEESVVEARTHRIISDIQSDPNSSDLDFKEKDWRFDASAIAERNGWTIDQANKAIALIRSKPRDGKQYNPSKLAQRLGIDDLDEELGKLALDEIRSCEAPEIEES